MAMYESRTTDTSYRKYTMNSFQPRRLTIRVLLLTMTVLAAACSSVPRETVELSYVMGQDIRELQRSYDRMIVDRFDTYRTQREAYLEDEWIPMFLDDWVEQGRLIDTARGDVVWDEESGMFVEPDRGEEQRQRLDTVLVWSREAVGAIERKRRELVDPLDEREAEIRADVREAFDQILAANAHITAQLNSLREVEEVQQDITRRLQVDDELQRINEALSDTSGWAQSQLEEIRDAGL